MTTQLDANGNMIVSQQKPAFQEKGVGVHLNLEVRCQFVPLVSFHFGYTRSANFGATVLVITKGGTGMPEVEIRRVALVAELHYFLDNDIELSHGEFVRFHTEGPAPGGGQTHSIQIGWEERSDGVL